MSISTVLRRIFPSITVASVLAALAASSSPAMARLRSSISEYRAAALARTRPWALAITAASSTTLTTST